MRLCGVVLALTWAGLWWTPDQQGQRLFEREEYTEAAERFVDPYWRGTAWYRAGEFEKATQSFARVAGPVGRFNEANAWVMLGKYDQAITKYDEALAKRPDWKEAQENRDLAAARAAKLDTQGGDAGDQKLGADEIVFDKKKDSGGQETQVAGEQATSNATVQAMWLRQVQTKPADFLKSKFAYQAAERSAEGDE